MHGVYSWLFLLVRSLGTWFSGGTDSARLMGLGLTMLMDSPNVNGSMVL